MELRKLNRSFPKRDLLIIQSLVAIRRLQHSWSLVIFVLFSIFLAEPAFSQTTCPVRAIGLNSDASQPGQRDLKSDSITLAERDMFSFCRANLTMRFLNANNIPPKSCLIRDSKSLEPIVDSFLSAQANKAPLNDIYALYDSWNLAMMSSRNSRALSIKRKIPGTDQLVESDYFRAGKYEPPDPLALEMLRRRRSQPKDHKKNWVDSAQKATVCISIGAPASCTRALDVIEELMRPENIGGLSITNQGAWEQLYADFELDRGLAMAAAEMETLVGTQRVSADSNVFTVLENSFRKSGMTIEKANDSAWLILGIIGSSGPNALGYANMIELLPSKPSSKGLALGLIASSMTYLDYLKLERGLPMFSYPANVKTTCDTAKPYHFWLSAFLARQLAGKQQIPRNTAMRTTFLAQQGYQIKRNLFIATGRNGISGVYARENYDPVHQVIRADLAYAAAGAFYGAYSGTSMGSKVIDVNQSLVNLLKNSNAVDPVKAGQSIDLLESYSRFNKLFSPDSAFQSFPRPESDSLN